MEADHEDHSQAMACLLEAAIVAAVASTSAVAQQSLKPNVVFILADNVGGLLHSARTARRLSTQPSPIERSG
jgi:hypothetical protein